jgi:hypothetical protein
VVVLLEGKTGGINLALPVSNSKQAPLTMRIALARMFAIVCACFLLLSSGSFDKAQARKARKATKSAIVARHTSRGGKSRHAISHRSSRRTRSAHRGRHHLARHSRSHVQAHAPKPKYAYPLGIFMAHAPAFDRSALEPEQAGKVAREFDKGLAHGYSARTLVRAGIFKHHALRGGIFYRREPVKYIVMHSTETGIPVPGKNVIESWSSMGLRHPGAQYVVDRDGTIYQALDPDLACVHVNIFKTLPGINNDNSIGIEMNHTGSQDYPYAQRQAVIRLVGYLQRRYDIQSGNVITHRYAQQGDHTDPVNFNFDEFLATVDNFKSQAIAYRVKNIREDARFWKHVAEPEVNTYLKPHQQLGKSDNVQEYGESAPASNVVPASLSSPSLKAAPAPAPAPSPVSSTSPALLPAPDSLPVNQPLSRPTPEIKPEARSEIIPIPVDGNGNPIESGKDKNEVLEKNSSLVNPASGGISPERREMWLRPYPGLK